VGLVSVELRRQGRKGYVLGLTGLMELITIEELRRRGFGLQTRKAVERLREYGKTRPLGSAVLMIRGGSLRWEHADDVRAVLQSIALDQPGELLFVFPAGEAYARLARELQAGENGREPAPIELPAAHMAVEGSDVTD
jgi:hypothetical protein